MTRFVPRVAWLLLLSLVSASSCGRQIGDDCGINADCGSGRICDTTQPGGYCTMTPCRPGTCPSEAQCVEFGPDHTYCMRACIDDDECRAGYQCVTWYLDYPGFCDQRPPSIGSPCATVYDCGKDRTCDTSLPGGYCTITPCEPGSCPDGSLCVDSGHDSRCMSPCSVQDDCRDGYACVEGEAGSYCGVLAGTSENQ